MCKLNLESIYGSKYRLVVNSDVITVILILLNKKCLLSLHTLTNNHYVFLWFIRTLHRALKKVVIYDKRWI